MKGLDEAWRQLDAEVDQIVNVADALKTEGDIDGAQTGTLVELKARARGKAEILAVFMTLYGARGYDEAAFEWTADDVSTEAGKRRAMRTRGREYFTVLTLGQLLQYDADGAWKRDGHGFVRVAS